MTSDEEWRQLVAAHGIDRAAWIAYARGDSAPGRSELEDSQPDPL